MKLALLSTSISLLFAAPAATPTPAPDTPADQQPLTFVMVKAPATVQLTRELTVLKRKVRQRGRIIRGLRRTLMHRPDVTEALQLTSVVYGLNYWSLRRRAFCESRLNPYAKNRSSDATGLFQLLYPSTWRTTPFSFLSPWSPYANALAAGYMLSHGRAGEWVCPG